MATAIQIINAALSELGLPTTSLTAATGDTLGIQSFALLNALGDELLRVHDWQFMERTLEFQGNGISDRFGLPMDFKRQINQTQWDKSNRRQMIGPDNAQTWGWSQYGLVGTGIFFRYRILGDEYAVFPVPGDGEQFALYYISKNWVVDGTNPEIEKDMVTSESDVPKFDRRLMVTGLKVKLWAAKGFDTTSLQQEFQYVLESEKSQNQGAPAISLSGRPDRFLLGVCNIPETGFGS